MASIRRWQIAHDLEAHSPTEARTLMHDTFLIEKPRLCDKDSKALRVGKENC
jgi:hypothetical protein